MGELERPYLAGRGAAGGVGEVVERLLQEGEQLRLETDKQGPQDEIEYWKAKVVIS